jgi:hypothetical protein
MAGFFRNCVLECLVAEQHNSVLRNTRCREDLSAVANFSTASPNRVVAPLELTSAGQILMVELAVLEEPLE